MTAPTLTSEQREALAVALSQPTLPAFNAMLVYEDMVERLDPVVAVMVAGAAHEAEAKAGHDLSCHTQANIARSERDSAVYEAERVGRQVYELTIALAAKTAELADLRGAMEALSSDLGKATDAQYSRTLVLLRLRALLNASSNP